MVWFFFPPISVQPTPKDERQAWEKLWHVWGSLLNGYLPPLNYPRVLPVLNSILRTVSKRHCLRSKNVPVHDFLKQRTTQWLAVLQGRKQFVFGQWKISLGFKKKKIHPSKLKLKSAEAHQTETFQIIRRERVSLFFSNCRQSVFPLSPLR